MTDLPVLSAVIQLELLLLHPLPPFPSRHLFLFVFTCFRLPLSRLSTCRSLHLDRVSYLRLWVFACNSFGCLHAPWEDFTMWQVCVIARLLPKKTKIPSDCLLLFLLVFLSVLSQVVAEVKTGHQNGMGRGERRGKVKEPVWVGLENLQFSAPPVWTLRTERNEGDQMPSRW